MRVRSRADYLSVRLRERGRLPVGRGENIPRVEHFDDVGFLEDVVPDLCRPPATARRVEGMREVHQTALAPNGPEDILRRKQRRDGLVEA